MCGTPECGYKVGLDKCHPVHDDLWPWATAEVLWAQLLVKWGKSNICIPHSGLCYEAVWILSDV